MYYIFFFFLFFSFCIHFPYPLIYPWHLATFHLLAIMNYAIVSMCVCNDFSFKSDCHSARQRATAKSLFKRGRWPAITKKEIQTHLGLKPSPTIPSSGTPGKFLHPSEHISSSVNGNTNNTLAPWGSVRIRKKALQCLTYRRCFCPDLI